jgi:hypothetical protein
MLSRRSPEQDRIGRKRELDRQRREFFHQLLKVRAQQRLAAGQPYLVHAQPGEDAAKPLDFAEVEQLVRAKKSMVGKRRARHAVGAAQVAAVGDRNAQRLQRAPEGVEHGHHE